MQHSPGKIGQLVDNRPEQVPAHVCRRLELLVSARAGGAQEIAAIGDFQMDADRWVSGYFGALAFDRFMVASRIAALVSKRITDGRAHCDRARAPLVPRPPPRLAECPRR